MLLKIVFLGVFAFCFVNASVLSLDKLDTPGSSSEEKENKLVMESLKEFVRMVEKYNLNVTVFGSSKEYDSAGWLKESMSMSVQMPVNDVYLTEATLDDGKQSSFLKKLDKLGTKEHVGAKTKVIQITNGEDHLGKEEFVNAEYLLDPLGYQYMTEYKNGVAGYQIPDNETIEILYNYVIKTPSSDGIKNAQFIVSDVVINEVAVTENFSADVLTDIKQVLPRLWLSIEDQTLLARLLVQYLDSKYSGSFQAMIGVEKFALGKDYAHLEVANTNVLVFSLS